MNRQSLLLEMLVVIRYPCASAKKPGEKGNGLKEVTIFHPTTGTHLKPRMLC